MANYQIAYAVLDDQGKLISGNGVTNSTHDSKKHFYAFQFAGGGFAAAPAVVLTGHPEEPVYARLGLYNKDENRQVDVKVNAYELASGKFKEANTGFHALAISQSTVANNQLSGEQDVQIVAGILGPAAAVQANYGGFSVSEDSSTGSYIIKFTHEFAEAPTVVATVEQEAAGVLTAHIDEASASSLEIVLRDGERQQVNGTVHFLAVGKRKEGVADGTHRFVCGVAHRDAQFAESNKKPINPVLAGGGFTVTVNEKRGAHYTLTLDSPFKKQPVLVACAEHMKERHLRQMQVHTPISTAAGYATLHLDVYGKEESRSGFNNSHFHFIAYAPE